MHELEKQLVRNTRMRRVHSGPDQAAPNVHLAPIQETIDRDNTTKQRCAHCRIYRRQPPIHTRIEDSVHAKAFGDLQHARIDVLCPIVDDVVGAQSLEPVNILFVCVCVCMYVNCSWESRILSSRAILLLPTHQHQHPPLPPPRPPRVSLSHSIAINEKGTVVMIIN